MAEEKKYGQAAVDEATLEAWPNPSPHRPYLIRMTLPEFTCLCPRSGYPDFATLKIRYEPRHKVVELRSLKLYINAFRDRAVSHEGAVNLILDELVALLDPVWMKIVGDFNVRGNIKTVIVAEHGRRSRGARENPAPVPGGEEE